MIGRCRRRFNVDRRKNDYSAFFRILAVATEDGEQYGCCTRPVRRSDATWQHCGRRRTDGRGRPCPATRPYGALTAVVRRPRGNGNAPHGGCERAAAHVNVDPYGTRAGLAWRTRTGIAGARSPKRTPASA